MPKIETLTEAERAVAQMGIGVDISTQSLLEKIPFAGLTAPTEYVDFIAMIDSTVGLGDGAVQKSSIGAATDGSTLIYSYVAGNPAAKAPAILLLAGQHSVEPVGQLAVVRVFEWFTRSAHPIARKLRKSFKLVMVPNANPCSFKAAGGGRLNPNGVNLNRNWPFFHAIYTPLAGEEVTNAKGAGPASEAETQRIMALFDTYNFVLAIDNHNMGEAPSAAERNTLQIGSASPWVRNNRSVIDAAMAATSAATGEKVTFFGVDFNGEPLFHSWASFRMTIPGGNRHATAAIIESYSDLAGGSERVLNNAGATIYCNAIVSIMRAQLEQGLRADPTRGYTTFALRANPQDTVSISQGGTLLDVTAGTPIQFDSIHNVSLAGTKRAFRDVPAPSNGLLYVWAFGYIESSGTTEQRVDAALVWNGAQSGTFITSITLSATAGLRQSFCFPGIFQVSAVPDAATVHRLALNIWKSGASTGTTPKIIRAGIAATFIPSDGSAPIPIMPALTA